MEGTRRRFENHGLLKAPPMRATPYPPAAERWNIEDAYDECLASNATCLGTLRWVELPCGLPSLKSWLRFGRTNFL
jgi:hypothetical protein